MNEFNYEDTFMGVMDGKRNNYIRTFRDDYRLKRLIEAVKIKRGKILDIGCGGGITTESLPYYYSQSEVYGCDVSKKAIDYAKKFGSGKVKYMVIKNKKLPYKDNYLDVCICLDVMEHIPDVNFFLKEVKRVLKKNGQFFLLVPCEGQPLTHTWFFQKIKIGDRMTFKRYGHIHPEFTHKYVEKLLKKHGFLIKNRMYSEHFLYQIVSLLIYFIPRELMDFFLGNNASKYSDSGIVKNKNDINKFDLLVILRDFWLGITRFLRFITSWELEVFKSFPVTAWKVIILTKVNK